MPIQFPGRHSMLELHQSHLSSSSSLTSNYAYPYVISTPSDAVDGPKAEMTSIDTMESGNDHIPTAHPWPESKPSIKVEEQEDADMDVQVKVVSETFRDPLRESQNLFKKILLKNQQDHLLKKEKNEEKADPESKAFLEMGKKKMNQTKAGTLQRSLSLDSPLSPLGRFKYKPPVLGGGGPPDIKG